MQCIAGARDIPEGGADVLVCEAFAGNVVLKMLEGVSGALIAKIKAGMMMNPYSRACFSPACL